MKESRRERDAGVVLARILLLAAFAILSALVLRNVLVLTGRDLALPLGLSKRVWPADATLTLIDQQLTIPQIDWKTRSEADVSANARWARQVDPLSEWPFALQGMVEEQRGHAALAGRLLDRSRSRNRRGVIPAYLILVHNARAGKVDETIRDLIYLLDEWPEVAGVLMPTLTSALQEEGSGRLAGQLRLHPDVRDNLVASLSRTPGSEALLTSLLAEPSVSDKVRLDAIENLGLRGRHDLAYPMWRKLLKRPPGVPFDPQFRGLRAPKPYMWNFESDGTASLDIVKRDGDGPAGLDVQAFSDSLSLVASQVMPIPAGAHSLTIDGTLVADGSGRLRWRLKCARTANELARAEFAGNQTRQSHTLRFTVPAGGCEFQELELFVVPDDSTMNYRMRFTGVTLDAREPS